MNQRLLFSINQLSIGLSILLTAACSPRKQDVVYSQTIDLSKSLHVEIFKAASQGAFGSDIIEEYLTDSSTFRVFVGRSDEYYDLTYYRLVGDDSILIRRSHKNEDLDSEMMIMRERTYSLEALKNVDSISTGLRYDLVSIDQNERK
jgi:hypothetical protein